MITAGLAVVLAGGFTSCAALDGLALRQRDKQYERMFASDPAGYVQSNIGKGDYSYWGFRDVGQPHVDWIPGITGKAKDLGRYDFTTIGWQVNEGNHGAAESFFRRYNLILKKERSEAIKRGAKLDVYGRAKEGPAGDPAPGRS